MARPELPRRGDLEGEQARHARGAERATEHRGCHRAAARTEGRVRERARAAEPGDQRELGGRPREGHRGHQRHREAQRRARRRRRLGCRCVARQLMEQHHLGAPRPDGRQRLHGELHRTAHAVERRARHGLGDLHPPSSLDGGLDGGGRRSLGKPRPWLLQQR